MEIVGVIMVLAVLVGIPILRWRIRLARIRREWYARGEGYARGKYSVARHPSYYSTAPADPEANQYGAGVQNAGLNAHNKLIPHLFGWIAVAIVGLMGLGFMGSAIVHSGSDSGSGVSAPRQSTAAPQKTAKHAARHSQPHAQTQQTPDATLDMSSCSKAGAIRKDGGTPPAELDQQCDAAVSGTLKRVVERSVEPTSTK